MSRHSNQEQNGGKNRYKDSKFNKDHDVSDLISFRYERPTAVQSTPHRSGRKSYPRNSAHHVSKAQFVQANFRFLLSPLTNPSEACLYDPDTIVPWQYVSCVILPQPAKHAAHVPGASIPHAPSHDHPWAVGSSPTITAADYEAANDINSDNVCPICLDEIQVPRITSCGHTFCYTCILRHLQSELRNCDKCPICAVTLCASDLKTVLKASDNLAHIFDAAAGETKSHRAGSMDSTNSTTHSTTHTSITDIVGQDVEFTLLQMTKGSIVPQLATADGSISALHTSTINGPPNHSLTLSAVLPECTAQCAPFNRLMHLTVENMRQLYAHDRAVLSQYRQLCLPKTTPVRYNSNSTNNTNTSTTTSTDFPALGSKAWEKGNKTQPNTANSTIKPTSEAVGDVEALPYIQLAMERQQLLESEFEAKLIQRAMVSSLIRESSGTSTASNTSNSNTSNTHDENATTSKLQYHVYQHTTGNLVYMHPICAKCILETSIHSSVGGVSSLTDGGESVHSIVPPKHSPRTQMQKKLHAGKGHSGKSHTDGDTSSNVDTNNATHAVSDTTPITPTTNNTSSTTAPTTTSTPLHLLTTLRARVVDSERVRVTPDTRTRYNVLRHLPLHAEVVLLEIDMAHMVPPHILCKYSEELHKRALRRKERAKQEKREKRLEQDRSMAEALLAQEHHDYLMQIREMELLQLDELHHGPAVGEGRGGGSGGGEGRGEGRGEGTSTGADNAAGDSSGADGGQGDASSAGGNTEGTGGTSGAVSGEPVAGEKKVFSFANITQMGGNFPTLGASASNKTAGSAGTAGAWGKSSTPGGAGAGGAGAGGTGKGGISSGSTSGVSGDVWGRGSKPPSNSAGSAGAGAGDGGSSGKKEKKTKIVLMSNNFRAGR